MHWHLDVTFKEDANKTIDKRAAENLNIIRKWCISILKMIEIYRHAHGLLSPWPGSFRVTFSRAEKKFATRPSQTRYIFVHSGSGAA